MDANQTPTKRICRCGGTVLLERQDYRGTRVARFACAGCGAATLYEPKDPTGAYVGTLIYAWDVIQDRLARADEAARGELDTDREQRLASEGVDRLIADLRNANGSKP